MNFEINGNKYNSTPLNVRDQFHLVRKMGAVVPLMGTLAAPSNADKDPTLLVTSIMAQLDDDAADFVLNKCLSVVSRDHMGSWSKLLASDGSLMFSDIKLADMMAIAAKVLVENVGSFFHTALTNLERAAEKTE